MFTVSLKKPITNRPLSPSPRLGASGCQAFFPFFFSHVNETWSHFTLFFGVHSIRLSVTPGRSVYYFFSSQHPTSNSHNYMYLCSWFEEEGGWFYLMYVCMYFVHTSSRTNTQYKYVREIVAEKGEGGLFVCMEKAGCALQIFALRCFALLCPCGVGGLVFWIA